GTPTTAVAENSPYSFVPSVTDPDTNDVQVFSIENKPSWATFDTNSGTLTGTPSFTSAGNYPDIKISVSDGTDSVSLGLFSITVTNMNGVPTISGVPPRSVAQGQSFEFTPVAVDPDGDTVSFSINTKLPAWLSFDPTTGRISGTPSINENGTTVANIVIAVTDVNMASARLPVFSITVCSACVLPNVLFTDIVSGPTSGGENDNGAYLNIFGTNFGPTAGLRTNTKVFINDVEVADYKFLGNAKAQPFVKNGTTIQHLAVQVGRIGGLAPGVAGAIKVVVAGVASNTDHTFINQPGDMIYVSLTGSDTTGDGSFARPYRKVQVATRDNPAWRAFGPGDTIVLRGGIWTDVGVEGRFVRIGREKSPTAPNGALGNGYSAFQAYPGENVTIDLKYAYGNHKGGFCGPPSDDNAFSHYFVFSGFNIRDDDPSKPTHSGTGPITSQSSGDHWRIVNNELTAKIGTITQKAGAISGGFRDAAILGNSIHDIEGLIVASKDPAMIAIGEDQEPLINHGMYFDNYNARVEVAYNHLKDISGGSGLQFFGNNGSVCGLPGCMLEELNIHHNVLENISGKYGLNFSWVVTSGTVYNNVVVHTKLPGLRLGSDHFSGMKVVNNSFYDVSYSGAYPAVFVDGNIFNNASNSDSIFVENNIIYASVTANGYYSYYNGAGSDSGVFMKNNLWFGKGLTPPSKDAGGKYGDPKYLSTSAGSEDLRIDTTSPAYNSAVVEASTYIPVNDASIQMRSGPLDIGAFEVQ
ncbi:MAG: putative Ig domain-containing protein, partial [Gammaproteobacteria bacterium]|nr:putative Ig domain-containing protein [Gammaproteobacteria bacterium]